MTIRINSFGIPIDTLVTIGSYEDERREVLQGAVLSSLASLGFQGAALRSVSEKIWSILRCKASEVDLKKELRAVLQANISEQLRDQALRRRAGIVKSQIERFLLSGSVLDWGCGDAYVAEMLTEHDVDLLDITDHRKTMQKARLTLYDEKQLPVSLEEQYDNVLLLTVLHHAQCPALTCVHACSSARRVIVIESTPELVHPALEALSASERFAFRYEYCGFVDWFYNEIIFGGIRVAFNYLPSRGWLSLFTAANFRLVHKEVLGLDLALVPEWHVLLVFEPQRK